MTGTDKNRTAYLSLSPYWSEVAAKALAEGVQTILTGWLCSDPDARTAEPLEAAARMLDAARELMRK